MNRVDAEIARRFVLIGVGLLLTLFAPAPTAAAQQLSALVECASAAPVVAESVTKAPTTTGFFAADVDSIAVRSGHQDQASTTAANQIANALVAFYARTDVGISLKQTAETSRAIVVDGDNAVPGEPSLFTLGGTPTLFVHWTTAEADIAKMLDVQSLEDVRAASGVSAPCAPPLAFPAATGILAYVDDTEDAAPGLPIALNDGSALDHWPIAAGAASALAASGLAARRRRRRHPTTVAFNDESGRSTIDRRLTEIASLIRAARPLKKPRVIFLDDAAPGSPESELPPTQREIDLASKADESALSKLMEKVSEQTSGTVLSREGFVFAANTEWSRHNNGGADGAIASLVLSELEAVRLRLGNKAAQNLFDEVIVTIADMSRPLDVLGLANHDELAILMPEVDEAAARDHLDQVSKRIAATTFKVAGERVLLTPATGYAMLSDTSSSPELIRAVQTARSLSMMNLHLDPERWDATASVHDAAATGPTRWQVLRKKLQTPMQIAITFVIAWVIPFLIYLGMDAVGLDISFAVYLIVVATLVITGCFILAECFMAVKQKDPPEVPNQPYPKATALIAAYLPNEAATVIETIDAFLAMDYPNDLQIILAYNTPDPLPVEEHLDQIAAEHPNFVPIRIVGSNSKAQNVNAALSMAEGEFIGMFDADHQPRPDAFTRAWRWIDDGYDVVQGHCLTRNGDAGWLAKMIAVEFEAIYAVAHPGRAKMHRFGVFGGSNGFWRTELLHETRMRGSMLTEDIDSSMRVVERGFKIRSDRDLVSRELATTTFEQVWNQRMRWAQGWFQVSIEHVKFAFRAKELTVRQKLGIFHLLMWREVYPWLSQQLFPLIAFWAVRSGGVDKLDWTVPIFVATSIFTFSVGPLQTIFAYKLADPEIKQHKSWFWGYLLFTTPFYTEYKNLIARVAHVKQFMGESDWRVTPRSADPVSMPDG